MDRFRNSFHKLIERLLPLWFTTFLIVFGIIATITSVYELFAIQTVNASSPYMFLTLLGVIALTIGTEVSLQQRQTVRCTARWTTREREQLLIELNIPEHLQVREIILDTERFPKHENQSKPTVRIRRRR